MDSRFDLDRLQRKQSLEHTIVNGGSTLPLFLTLACLSSTIFAQTLEPSKGSGQFVRDVVPILRDKCISCHGPKIQQAGLRLDTRIDMLRGGKSGPAISGE